MASQGGGFGQGDAVVKLVADTQDYLARIQAAQSKTSKTLLDIDSSIKRTAASIDNTVKNTASRIQSSSASVGKGFSAGLKNLDREIAAKLKNIEQNAIRAQKEAQRAMADSARAYEKELSNMTSAAAIARQSIVGLFTTGFIASTIQAAARLDSMKKALISVEGSVEGANKRLKEMREIARLPGLSLEPTIQGFVSLKSAGLSAELATRSLRAFGGALSAVGKGSSEMGGVVLALTQIAARGKFAAQEINQLSQRIPQIRMILKDAFGTNVASEIEKLGLPIEVALEKMVKAAEKIQPASAGIAKALEESQEAMSEAAAAIGEIYAPAFLLGVSAMGQFTKAIVFVSQALSTLPDALKPVVSIMALLATADIAIAIAGLGGLGKVIKGVVTAAGAARLSMAAFAASLPVMTLYLAPLLIGLTALLSILQSIKELDTTGPRKETDNDFLKNKFDVALQVQRLKKAGAGDDPRVGKALEQLNAIRETEIALEKARAEWASYYAAIQNGNELAIKPMVNMEELETRRERQLMGSLKIVREINEAYSTQLALLKQREAHQKNIEAIEKKGFGAIPELLGIDAADLVPNMVTKLKSMREHRAVLGGLKGAGEEPNKQSLRQFDVAIKELDAKIKTAQGIKVEDPIAKLAAAYSKFGVTSIKTLQEVQKEFALLSTQPLTYAQKITAATSLHDQFTKMVESGLLSIEQGWTMMGQSVQKIGLAKNFQDALKVMALYKLDLSSIATQMERLNKLPPMTVGAHKDVFKNMLGGLDTLSKTPGVDIAYTKDQTKALEDNARAFQEANSLWEKGQVTIYGLDASFQQFNASLEAYNLSAAAMGLPMLSMADAGVVLSQGLSKAAAAAGVLRTKIDDIRNLPPARPLTSLLPPLPKSFIGNTIDPFDGGPNKRQQQQILDFSAERLKAMKEYYKHDMANLRDLDTRYVEHIELAARMGKALDPKSIKEYHAAMKRLGKEMEQLKPPSFFANIKSMLGQQISTIVTDLSRSLANLIIPAPKAKSLVAGVPEQVIRSFQRLYNTMAGKGEVDPVAKIKEIVHWMQTVTTAEKAAEIGAFNLGEIGPEVARMLREGVLSGEQLAEVIKFSADQFGELERAAQGLNRVSEAIREVERSILRAFVEIGAKALAEFAIKNVRELIKDLGGLTGALTKIGGIIGKIFGGGGKKGGLDLPGMSSTLGGILHPALSAAAPAAGAAGNIAANAAKLGAQAAGTAMTAVVGAVSGVVSAVSGIIGNFQMRAMNKSLDLIEKETRFSQIHLSYILEKMNEFLPFLASIHDRLMTIVGNGVGVFNATGDGGLRVLAQATHSLSSQLQGESGKASLPISIDSASIVSSLTGINDRLGQWMSEWRESVQNPAPVVVTLDTKVLMDSISNRAVRIGGRPLF